MNRQDIPRGKATATRPDYISTRITDEGQANNSPLPVRIPKHPDRQTRPYYIFARISPDSRAHYQILANLSPRHIDGWYLVKQVQATNRKEAILFALPPEFTPSHFF